MFEIKVGEKKYPVFVLNSKNICALVLQSIFKKETLRLLTAGSNHHKCIYTYYIYNNQINSYSILIQNWMNPIFIVGKFPH